MFTELLHTILAELNVVFIAVLDHHVNEHTQRTSKMPHKNVYAWDVLSYVVSVFLVQ